MAKKNQITIQLGNVNPTKKQRQKLHAAIHKAMAKEIARIEKQQSKQSEKGLSRDIAPAAADATKTATLHVSFSSVNPGLSNVTAKFKTQSQTITQTGDISFDGIRTGDSISVSGDSPGSTTITIDIPADPTQMNFSPGQMIAGAFFIE